MSVLRPLYVAAESLPELGQAIDRLRAEMGEHVLRQISHAAVPDTTARTSVVYSAIVILELPDGGVTTFT